LFYWSEDLSELVTDLLTHAPSFAVAGIIRRMAYHYRDTRDGFPDLMLVKEGAVKFVEIKAEGDQIRHNQLARLTLLRQVGFEADICRVKYVVDPQQTYVVVDVETTGRAGPYGRITEIAALKVRGGEVLDTWHSLINPECRIPAMITELTGIDNEMVKDAPVFAQIADSLAEFIEGSVFVAHNVNFDHGFIASEYARLERHFRHPKLCTCAGMRRHYPGHSSYGLANLTREYGIPLKNHHRALADAQAATELLHLVNIKRAVKG
jgi:DNA polymerase-3 subunit epsilon